MSYKILLLLSGVFFSCTPQHRLSRLVERHPHLVGSFDTALIIRDTFVVPGDTVERIIPVRKWDTVVVEKERIRVRVITRPDTIEITGECTSDTVYLDTVIRVAGRQVTVAKRELPLWSKIALVGLAFVCVVLVLKIALR